MLAPIGAPRVFQNEVAPAVCIGAIADSRDVMIDVDSAGVVIEDAASIRPEAHAAGLKVDCHRLGVDGRRKRSEIVGLNVLVGVRVGTRAVSAVALTGVVFTVVRIVLMFEGLCFQ